MARLRKRSPASYRDASHVSPSSRTRSLAPATPGREHKMTECDPDNEATFRACVIRSELKETCAPKQQILAELQRCKFGEDATFAVKLALEEALTNAVKHGSQNDASRDITIRYAVSPEKAVIIVRDEGPGFLPDNVPDCTHPDRLPLPEGRGIMLLRAYMDEVCFRDRGREVYFMKQRSSTGIPAGIEKSPTPVRRTVFYSGRVQGVNFRYTTETIASRLPVTGFVRNLSDGRVEMVAEGDDADLDRLMAQIEQAMQGLIQDTCASASPATGEFKDFAITY